MRSGPPGSAAPGRSRDHRRALVGLVALVLLLAVVVTPIVVLQLRDGSPEAGPTGPTGAASAATSDPTSADPSPEPTPPQPILLGSLTYVSPCTLLPLADVERIFGSLGPQGFVQQEYLDASLSPVEFAAQTRTGTGNVRTRCSYSFDDRAENSLDLTVEQYRSERVAAAQWASIAYLGTGKESRKLAHESFKDGFGFVVELARENERDMGGKPVAGARTQLLYVPGHQAFVMRFGNTVVTARYGDGLSVFADKPLTAKQYAAQAPRMRQVLAAVAQHWPDRATDQAPMPTAIGGGTALGATPYLEPCQILDATAFAVATGRAPDPGAESTSLIRDPDARLAAAGTDVNADPYRQTSVNKCSRRVHWPKDKPLRTKTSDATLEIRYAQDPASAPELLERHLVWRYVQDEKARSRVHLSDFINAKVLREHPGSDADSMYVFDSTPLNGHRDRYVDAFFTYGPYEFMLTSTRGRGLALHSGTPLTDEQYAAAVDAIVANVQAATQE